MRTIFDGLVEEFRAWHLFEQQAGDSPQRDLRDLPRLGLPGPGAGGQGGEGYRGPGYGGSGSGEAGSGAGGFGTPEYGGPEYGWAGWRDRDAGGVPRPGGPR